MLDRSVTPRWTVWYLWLMVVVVGAFTVLGYLQPQALIGTWQAIGAPGALDLSGPLGLWMARNLAFITLTLFALLLRSPDLLLGALVFRAVADFFDFVHWGVVSGQLANGALPIVMALIAAVGVAQTLRRRTTALERQTVAA